MTENDLTNLGFNKVEIKDLDSQNGYDYYYYTFEVFENLTLCSVDSDMVENDNWYVTNLEWPDHFKLHTLLEVQSFLQSVGYQQALV
jgi:hypothetical protein